MKILNLIFLLLILASCESKRLRMVSTVMEGTIKKEQIVLMHPVDKVERNQIVVFKHHEDEKEELWVFRVVGVPGDKLEMKRGKLFVNDKAFKEPVTLKSSYQVTTDGILNPKMMEKYEGEMVAENLFYFYLTEAEKKELKDNPVIKEVTLLMNEPGYYEDFIFLADSTNKWNIDNFGPLLVPDSGEGSYFLLGDNRHMSADSRYYGFVERKDIVGFVDPEEKSGSIMESLQSFVEPKK